MPSVSSGTHSEGSKENATASRSCGRRPAYSRHHRADSAGISQAEKGTFGLPCFRRLKRSSSAAATTCPSTTSAAAGSWNTALIPRTRTRPAPLVGPGAVHPRSRQAASGSLVGREPLAPWSVRASHYPGEALVTPCVLTPLVRNPFGASIFTCGKTDRLLHLRRNAPVTPVRTRSWTVLVEQAGATVRRRRVHHASHAVSSPPAYPGGRPGARDPIRRRYDSRHHAQPAGGPAGQRPTAPWPGRGGRQRLGRRHRRAATAAGAARPDRRPAGPQPRRARPQRRSGAGPDPVRRLCGRRLVVGARGT